MIVVRKDNDLPGAPYVLENRRSRVRAYFYKTKTHMYFRVVGCKPISKDTGYVPVDEEVHLHEVLIGGTANELEFAANAASILNHSLCVKRIYGAEVKTLLSNKEFELNVHGVYGGRVSHVYEQNGKTCVELENGMSICLNPRKGEQKIIPNLYVVSNSPDNYAILNGMDFEQIYMPK